MLMKLQAPKAGKTLLQAKDSNILVQKQSQTVFMSLRADMPDTVISGTWKLHRSSFFQTVCNEGSRINKSSIILNCESCRVTLGVPRIKNIEKEMRVLAPFEHCF